MIAIEIEFLEQDAVSDTLKTFRVESQMGSRRMRLFVLQGGTTSGKPSVSLAVEKDDGSWFMCETSAAAFCAAAAAVKGAAQRWRHFDIG